MGGGDLLETIEAVHAVGLDARRWPQVLAAVAGFCGAAGTTREALRKPAHHKPAQYHNTFCAPGSPEIMVPRRLAPRVQQVLDVAARLKGAGEASHSFERVLEWLSDGILLVRANGSVVYANEAFHAIARQGDGIRLKRRILDFAAAEAYAHFEAAIGMAGRLRSGDPLPRAMTDFPVSRPSGAPAYLISIRPLLDRHKTSQAKSDAVAIVFVRGSGGRGVTTIELLREMFRFTEAEANLAQALQGGISLDKYARARAVSLNTVYTHLRRIKEKTGCKRMAELIYKLNNLQVPSRVT